MILTSIVYSCLTNGWSVMVSLLSPASSFPSSPGLSTSQWPPSSRGNHLGDVLLPLLSKNAQVYYPGTEGFENGTRTLAAKKPQLDLLVRVATAEDVATTIRFANEHHRPFLAISGGHGETWDKGLVKHGIGISTSGLAYVNVSEDGTSATIGGGSRTGEVVRTLWAQGKQAVTTACDCAGIVAPILGGGHGWLQGQHGLLADNLISTNLILANGTAVVVSSSSHPDLFWALRGAGHNFGIVTSVKYRIEDIPTVTTTIQGDQEEGLETWAYEEYVFLQDRLEDLFSLANDLMVRSEKQARPVELTHYAHFEHRAEVDADNPVIVFWLIWQGATTVPSTYTKPIRALHPQSVETGATNITGLNAIAGAADGTPACENDGAHSALMFGVSLTKWNIGGLRTALEVFGDLPNAIKNTSIVLLEAYSTNAVMTVPGPSTAYPDRWNQLLLSPMIMYPSAARKNTDGSSGTVSSSGGSGDDEVIDDDMVAKYGARIRSALLQGSGQRLHAYVNYAHGDEILEAVYGYEDWRLQRLRRLKAEYDPENRFGYYAPIPPAL